MEEILSQRDFKSAIEKGVTLVDFDIPWCAPCRAQDPILARLAERFAGKATVVKVDMDENRKTALSFGIRVPRPQPPNWSDIWIFGYLYISASFQILLPSGIFFNL